MAADDSWANGKTLLGGFGSASLMRSSPRFLGVCHATRTAQMDRSREVMPLLVSWPDGIDKNGGPQLECLIAWRAEDRQLGACEVDFE